MYDACRKIEQKKKNGHLYIINILMNFLALMRSLEGIDFSKMFGFSVSLHKTTQLLRNRFCSRVRYKITNYLVEVI